MFLIQTLQEFYEISRNLFMPFLLMTYPHAASPDSTQQQYDVIIIPVTLIRSLISAILSLLSFTDCYCFIRMLSWKLLQSATRQNALTSAKRTVSETHGKDYDREYGVQASEGIVCPWPEKGFQNSGRESHGFIQLLTQDWAERKLITWGWMNWWRTIIVLLFCFF